MSTTTEALALAEAFRNNTGITGADKVAAALTSLAAERDQLRAELEKLRRGEFICQKCGLRKDADAGPVPF